jgi:hypothetical protein
MLQFRGSAVTSDAGFLVYCEHDPAMRLIVNAGHVLHPPRARWDTKGSLRLLRKINAPATPKEGAKVHGVAAWPGSYMASKTAPVGGADLILGENPRNGKKETQSRGNCR